MKNLRSLKELTGYTVHAADGGIGKVREIYFDDTDWRVRYLVVNTGRWLPGRKILLPPAFVEDIQWKQRKIQVASTREQVRNSPRADTDLPVVLQRKAERAARFNWPLALAAEALTSVPEALQLPGFEPSNRNGKPFDLHLRTSKVVTGLALRAKDGLAGRIVDLVVDDASWDIRYLVVEIQGGKRVLLPPQQVKDILIDEKVATTDLPLGDITTGPVLDPSTLLTCSVEAAVAEHLHNHGRESWNTERSAG